MSTCNQFELGTLGYRMVMPINLPGHWSLLLKLRIARRCGFNKRQVSMCNWFRNRLRTGGHLTQPLQGFDQM